MAALQPEFSNFLPRTPSPIGDTGTVGQFGTFGTAPNARWVFRNTPRRRWRPRSSGETVLGMLAAFSITPIGTGESVGDLVAETVRIVRASGLPNETNAMFTNVEGEWDEIMAVIKRAWTQWLKQHPAFRWW